MEKQIVKLGFEISEDGITQWRRNGDKTERKAFYTANPHWEGVANHHETPTTPAELEAFCKDGNFGYAAPDELCEVDNAIEGDSYDGDLPELDPYDYDGDDELEQAEEQRRREYWRLTGLIATSHESFYRVAYFFGIGPEEADEIAENCPATETGVWPICCHISYERGDGYTDEMDSIEGTGHFGIL